MFNLSFSTKNRKDSSELVANTKTKERITLTGLTPEQMRDANYEPMLYIHDRMKEEHVIMESTPGAGILRMMPWCGITKEQMSEGLKLLEETLMGTVKKFSLPRK